MNPLVINKKEPLKKEEKEKFFQQLESNPELLKESLEVILTLIVSDPKLTYQVADLIGSDYRNLYLAMSKNKEQVEKQAHSSCCQSPKN